MTQPGETSDRDPVDLLVETFLANHRRGESADVEAFAVAHPEHGDALRELLPTLLALEQMKRDKRSSSGMGAVRMALPPMERLGDFRITGEVGRGGMGVVFEAMQESLGRRVALKVLPQASLLTGNQLERFRREAQIASQLHHSNIVPVFGSGVSDGFHWYAMQFIAGQSLDHWRSEQAAAPPQGSGAWRARARFVARVGMQAASALQHAHAHGTLHRDIKPGNLLLERGEHVWVTDFGLAKALEADGLTHSGDLLGTLQYMAPEQFAGQYDVRSEVYALGITLYELLVLRPAFAANTRSELMERIRTQSPAPLQRAAPDVPDDLAIVVERAMARDPGDRYASAGALAADLEAFLEDRPIAARRHSAPQLVWRWCRRNRAMATLAACTLLAVVAAAVTGWTAYVVTDDALARAQAANTMAQKQTRLVETNLKLTLDAFGDVFDALVGRDPALAFEEDPDTGEQPVAVRSIVQPRDVALLQQMLAFYDRFAAENADNQSLRLEAARARRRVGAIQARLGNLDEAVAGYDRALERFRAITNRDVTREIADVHLAYGQLEQRRRRPAEAEQRFRLALDLLGPDRPEDARAVRFQRAEAHFLLAGSASGRRPAPDRREMERGRSEARRELAAARAIVVELLQREPENPEFLALHARCLLVSGGPGRRGAERDEERDADRRAGIETFRRLVQAHPDADQYAYELCDALLDDRRRPQPGGPRSPDAADATRRPETERRRREEREASIARLLEAKQLAVHLLEQQPDFAEYQLLRGRVGTALGLLLTRSAADDEAQRLVRRSEAEAELRAALQLLEAFLQRSKVADPPVLLQSVATRSALVQLLADTGRSVEARTEAAAAVATLRQLAEARDRGRPPLNTVRPLDAIEAVLKRVGGADLVRELAEVRESLLPPEHADRDGSPPGRRPR